MRQPRLLAVLCLLAAALALPPAAVASCVDSADPAAAMPSAPIVFVGSVTAVGDQGSTATVDVEEIWKGPNISDPVTVQASSPESPTWRVGTQYLFFPTVDADGTLADPGCSSTSIYKPAFDALRPATAHPPQGPPTSGVPGAPPIAAIFLAILVLGSVAGFLLYRSGRRQPG